MAKRKSSKAVIEKSAWLWPGQSAGNQHRSIRETALKLAVDEVCRTAGRVTNVKAVVARAKAYAAFIRGTKG